MPTSVHKSKHQKGDWQLKLAPRGLRICPLVDPALYIANINAVYIANTNAAAAMCSRSCTVWVAW